MVDTADEMSIPRVAVIPMKTPSQMKAAMPHRGMSTAHGKYVAEASITVVSLVRRARKALPPKA